MTGDAESDRRERREAEQRYRAVSEDPALDRASRARAATELGALLSIAGRHGEAVAAFRLACSLSPDQPAAWLNLSVAHGASGKRQLAIDALEQGFAAEATNLEIHKRIAALCGAAGALDIAAAHGRVVASKASGDSLWDLGRYYVDNGRGDLATIFIGAAASREPGRAEFVIDLARASVARGDHEVAGMAATRAITIAPNRGSAWVALGQSREAVSDYEGAERALGRAIQVEPEDVVTQAEFIAWLGRRRRWDEALAHWRTWKSERLGGLLVERSYEAAFRHDWKSAAWLSQWRQSWVPVPEPRWRGESLSGTVAWVLLDEGLGDAIQNARYLSVIAAAAAEVRVVTPHRSLVGLLASSFPSVQFQGPTDRVGDVHLLGSALRAWIDEPSLCSVPYLHVDAGIRSRCRGRLEVIVPAEKPRIGICWRGSGLLNPDRNIGIEELAPAISAVGDVSVVSLQVASASELRAARELGVAPFWMDIPNGTGFGPGLEETAAMILDLDLVVTIDTSIAHLAGALGAPTWVLGRRLLDPRWSQRPGERSLYPGTRVFQQTRRGDWTSVLEMVACELRAVVWGWCEIRRTGVASVRPAVEGRAV